MSRTGHGPKHNTSAYTSVEALQRAYHISVLLILLERIFGSYPAGVAATNCRGVTMPSAAGLPISDRLHDLQHYLDISSHPKEKPITNSLQNVDSIILVEASMISSNSLLMINRRL